MVIKYKVSSLVIILALDNFNGSPRSVDLSPFDFCRDSETLTNYYPKESDADEVIDVTISISMPIELN